MHVLTVSNNESKGGLLFDVVKTNQETIRKNMRKDEQIKPSTPITVMAGMPVWHHHHSSKIRAKGFNSANSPKERALVMGSNAVDILVSRSTGSGWIVEYKINQGPEAWSMGRVYMTDLDIRAAFGLSNTCAAFGGQNVVNRYGGDVAHQGRYLRYGSYLNIPGPGTGNDGDANLSIELNDEIKKSVEQLLE